MRQLNVLIFGDCRETIDSLAYALSQAGIGAVAEDLNTIATKRFEDDWVDLVIVDICLAQTQVVPLCRELSTRFQGPFLVMGYESDERVLLRLYAEGVAEYIVKPISVPLFAAKVTAWLRRIRGGKDIPQNGQDSFRVNSMRRFVTTPEGQHVRLSKLEYQLFEILCTNKGRVLPTNLLIERIWGGFEDGDSRLKHLILRLRRKIEPNPRAPMYIETVEQQGYRFRAVYRSHSHM